MCLSSPLFDLSGARPVDFLPRACYPSRPAVSGVTGVYSSTTHHFAALFSRAWIKRCWNMAKEVNLSFGACIMRAFEVTCT